MNELRPPAYEAAPTISRSLRRAFARTAVGALALGLSGLGAVGTISVGARSSLADTAIPASPAEARAQAKKYFDQGALDYTQGNYEAAVEAWQKSYDLSKEPLIFENIGNAYERLGKPKEARDALSKWREVAPPEEHTILDRRIANLDQRIQREEEEERRKKAEEEELKKRADAHGPGGGEVARGPAFSIPGVIIGSVGLAAVIAGVAVDGAAASKRPDASTACKKSGTSQLCLASAKDDIKTSNTLAVAGDVTWIIGAAAVATGGVLLLTYKRPTSKEPPKTGRVDVVPVAGPGGGGLFLEGRW